MKDAFDSHSFPVIPAAPKHPERSRLLSRTYVTSDLKATEKIQTSLMSVGREFKATPPPVIYSPVHRWWGPLDKMSWDLHIAHCHTHGTLDHLWAVSNPCHSACAVCMDVSSFSKHAAFFWEIFFSSWLDTPVDVEPEDMEGQLHFKKKIKQNGD